MFDKQKIIKYLEDKHLSDGGYFFAKVEPSSGFDTYLAVKTLRILGERRENRTKKIVSFWDHQEKNGNINNINDLFLFYGTFEELGLTRLLSVRHKKIMQRIVKGLLFKKGKLRLLQKKFGLSDPSIATLYTDLIEGELKELWYFTYLASKFDFSINKNRIADFFLSFENEDGGFGKLRDSQLSTTFQALNIFSLINYPLNNLPNIKDYLNHQFLFANYIEELYWLVESLSIIKMPLPPKDYLALFLSDCFRSNGGFSRSRNIGISTIEYTFYGVSILDKLGVLK